MEPATTKKQSAPPMNSAPDSKRKKSHPLADVSSQPDSRLLSIPRELRDQIYDEVWKQTPSIYWIPFRNMGFEVTYPGQETTPETGGLGRRRPQWVCIEWLLTCKQFLCEGIKQFELKATWISLDRNWRGTQPIPTLLSLSPFQSKSLVLDLSNDYRFFGMAVRLEWSDEDKTQIRAAFYYPGEVRMLHELGLGIRDCNALQSLEFRIRFDRTPSRDIPISSRFLDFSVLKMMAAKATCLNQFKLVISAITWGENEKFLDFFKKQVPLLGKELIKGGNKEVSKSSVGDERGILCWEYEIKR